MGGYLNRVIHKEWPDLAGRERDEDPNSRSIIWLTIRNPKLMAGGELMSGRSQVARRNADGAVVIDEEAAEASFGAFSKLIIGGNVLDPTVDSDDPPALSMPPSPEDMAKYPIEILNWLGEVVNGGVPH
jgi:hypothetical protein